MEHELDEEAPGWKTGAARTVERVFLMHWLAEAPPTAKMRLQAERDGSQWCWSSGTRELRTGRQEEATH